MSKPRQKTINKKTNMKTKKQIETNTDKKTLNTNMEAKEQRWKPQQKKNVQHTNQPYNQYHRPNKKKIIPTKSKKTIRRP